MSGFNPAHISYGLTFWLRADAGVYNASMTPAVDGEAVYQWNDMSANSIHVLQAAAGNQPVYIQDGGAGNNHLPVVRFDGNDLLQDNSVLGSDLFGEFETDIFIVQFENGLKVQNTTFAWGTSEPNVVRIHLETDNLLIFDFGYNLDDYQRLQLGSPIDWHLGFHIIELLKNSDSGVSNAFMYIDTKSIGNSELLGSLETAEIHPIKIGYWGAPWILKGDIAEIIIYNRALSNLERNMVHCYLSKKYGIELYSLDCE
jgi:hypothetical protein